MPTPRLSFGRGSRALTAPERITFNLWGDIQNTNDTDKVSGVRGYINARRTRDNACITLQDGDIVPGPPTQAKYQTIYDGTLGHEQPMRGITRWLPGNHDMGTAGDGFPFARSRETNDLHAVFTGLNAGVRNSMIERDTWDDSGTHPGPKDSRENWYEAFHFGAVKFLLCACEFGVNDDMMAWLTERMIALPAYNVIFMTHSYLDPMRQLENSSMGTNYQSSYEIAGSSAGVINGREIWRKYLRRVPNLVLCVNGHLWSSTHRITAIGPIDADGTLQTQLRNGDFSAGDLHWNEGVGWAISGGQAHKSSGTASKLTQVGTTVDGPAAGCRGTCRIRAKITSGEITVTMGDSDTPANRVIRRVNPAIEFEWYETELDQDASSVASPSNRTALHLGASADCVCDIDEVQFIPEGSVGDAGNRVLTINNNMQGHTNGGSTFVKLEFFPWRDLVRVRTINCVDYRWEASNGFDLPNFVAKVPLRWDHPHRKALEAA